MAVFLTVCQLGLDGPADQDDCYHGMTLNSLEAET